MIISSIASHVSSATSKEQDRMFPRNYELSRHVLRNTVWENLWSRLCTMSVVVITVSGGVMTSSHLFNEQVMNKSIEHLLGIALC